MRLEINLQAGSLFSFKKLAQKDDKPSPASILSAAPLPSLCSQSGPSSDRAPSELADTAAIEPKVKDDCLNRDHVLDDDRPVSKARGRLLTDVIQKIEQRTFDRSGIPVLDGYDLSDTFIDDTDLSETLAANADDVGLRHKGFFINEGELETYKRRKPAVKRKKAMDHRSSDTKKKFRSRDKTSASVRDSDRGSDEAQLVAMTEADTRLSRSDTAQVNDSILSSTTPAEVHPTPPSSYEPSAVFPAATDIVAAGSHSREDENCCRLPYSNKSEFPIELEPRSIPLEIENLLQEFRLKREALGPAAFSPTSAVDQSLLRIQMILQQDRFAHVSKAAVAERLSLILPLTGSAILERLTSSDQKAPGPTTACREDLTRRIDEAIESLKRHVDSTGCTSTSLQVPTGFCGDDADGPRVTSGFLWDQKCNEIFRDIFQAKQAYGKFLRQHSTNEEERKMAGSRTDMRRFYSRILSCWPNGKMSTEELKLKKSEIMRSSSASSSKKKRKSATKTTAPEEPPTCKKTRRDNSSSSSESPLSDSTARESAKPELLALSKSKEDRSPSREKASKKQKKKDKDKKSDKESRSHKKDKDKDTEKETKSHKKDKDRDSEKQRSKKKEKRLAEEKKKKKHKKDKDKEPKDIDDYRIGGHSSALTDVTVAPKVVCSRAMSRGQSSSSGDLDGAFKKHRFENDDAKMAKAYSEVLSSPVVSATDMMSLLKKRTGGAGDVPAYSEFRPSPHGSPSDIVSIPKPKSEPRSRQKKKPTPDASTPDPTVPKKRARDSHSTPLASETNLFDKAPEDPREKARREAYPPQRSVPQIAPPGPTQSRSRSAGPAYPAEPAYPLSQPGIQPPSQSGSGGSARYREDTLLPRDTTASIPKPSLHPALAPMSFDPSCSPRLPVDLSAFHNPSPLSAVRASSTAASPSPTLHPPTSSPQKTSPSRMSVPYAPASSRATYPPRPSAVEDQFSRPSSRDPLPAPQGFQPRLAARGSLPSLNSLDQGFYDQQRSFQSLSPPESKQYVPYSSLSPPHQYENENPYYPAEMSAYPMDAPYMKQGPFFNPQYSQYAGPNAPPVDSFRKAPQTYAPYP